MADIKNLGSNVVKDGESYPVSTMNVVTQKKRVLVKFIGTNAVWDLSLVDTVEGETFTTLKELAEKIQSFKTGGGAGNGGADLPEWVLMLRADRVGGVNMQENGSYQVGSLGVDATEFIAGNGEDFNKYQIRFPKINGIRYKRHMIIFFVNVKEITTTTENGVDAFGIPKEARKGDIWTLTYDDFSTSWHLEAINSVPKWYVDEMPIKFLKSIPGFGAGKVLSVNATGDDFEWVTP